MNTTSHTSAIHSPSLGMGGRGNLRWLGLLMTVAILAITGFQLYWLRQNYAREKKTLTIKTDAAFRKTMMRLQTDKLKLDGINRNGKKNNEAQVKIFVNDHTEQVNEDVNDEMISTINILRDKLFDSLKREPGVKSEYVISMQNTSASNKKDTLRFEHRSNGPSGRKDYLFNLLYGVDSLQEPLRLAEIDSAFVKTLQKEKINIPFSIIKKDSISAAYEPEPNEMIVGFAKPVAYKVKLGNTVPYLIKQITQPVLFSILLMGITILSFVLLYKNLLRQRRLADLKNEFISNITHELKTPIATVGVAIEALKNFNAIHDPVRTKEYLDISQNELKRLSLLVDKVLKLSMFEKKEMDLKFEPVNLAAIAEEVTSSMRLQLEKQKAVATVLHTGDTTIQGDKLHLQSLIFNLVDNALKYSKENPVIEISLKEKEEKIEMALKDNGIGIPAEFKNKIFEKFFRVPHGDTHNAKGHGLGLSYTAQVVKQHNGTIAVESKPGEGTIFIITLPRQQI